MTQQPKTLMLLTGLLFLAATLGWVWTGTPVKAQDGQNIDDVINRLDRDFTFGGKEEIKRQNVETANEQNREDIKIEETEGCDSDNGSSNPNCIAFNYTINVCCGSSGLTCTLDGDPLTQNFTAGGPPFSESIGVLKNTTQTLVCSAGPGSGLTFDLSGNGCPGFMLQPLSPNTSISQTCNF